MIPKSTAERHGFGVSGIPISGRDTLIDKLRSLLPGVVTENGQVDFDVLRDAVDSGGGGKSGVYCRQQPKTRA